MGDSIDGTKARTGMTLAVIGCGTMATAILSGVIDACSKDEAEGREPKFAKFVATVQSDASVTRLKKKFSAHTNFRIIQGDNVEAMEEGVVLLFGFKPYMLDLVLRAPGVKEAVANKLLLSVLAGSPALKILRALYAADTRPKIDSNWPTDCPYIKRAMPNLAAQFGQSMTVIETDTTLTPHLAYDNITNWIFKQLGQIQSVPTHLFDIGGALAGTSSAFMSVAFDGMLDGAVSQGMKRADAKDILRQTLLSLAALLEDEHPAVLRERVSSPKGTTMAGLLCLEEGGARWAYTRAVVAASQRSEAIQREG